MDIAKAERMAKRLIRKHLQSRGVWEFRFDNARRYFGACRFNPLLAINDGVVTYPTPGGVITLSRLLTELNDEEQVKDTILHEIAHALCGPRGGHTESWIRTARSVGCSGEEHCDSEKVTFPAAKYIAECPKCGYQANCYTRRNISCGRCGDTFNPAYLMVFRIHEAADGAAVKKARAPKTKSDGNTRRAQRQGATERASEDSGPEGDACR